MLEILSQENRGLRAWNAHGLMLKTLLEDLSGIVKVTGDVEVAITSLTMDSRKVVPGELFFALQGDSLDGNQFINEAIDKGAGGIVSEHSINGITQVAAVAVFDIRQTMALVSKKYYDAPDKKLKLIRVTRTNGKTTGDLYCKASL